MSDKIQLKSIGIIHTPYIDDVPFRADESVNDGEYCIEVFEEYKDALFRLDEFNYTHVLFYIDKAKKPKLKVNPPYLNVGEVGLFASRSPNRFNPIGLSTVEIKKIEGSRIYTSCLDVLDGTPLLDIKPYIKDLDLKPGSNMGWK